MMYDVIERLRLLTENGSYAEVGKWIGVGTNAMTYYRKVGYLPESQALAVHRLGLTDCQGPITAVEVLEQAEMVKSGEGIPLLPDWDPEVV